MSNPCLICGADFNMELASGDIGFKCGTYFTVGGHWHISKPCHERATARLRQFKAKALPILEWIVNHDFSRGPLIPGVKTYYTSKDHLMQKQATDLLAERGEGK